MTVCKGKATGSTQFRVEVAVGTSATPKGIGSIGFDLPVMSLRRGEGIEESER